MNVLRISLVEIDNMVAETFGVKDVVRSILQDEKQ